MTTRWAAGPPGRHRPGLPSMHAAGPALLARFSPLHCLLRHPGQELQASCMSAAVQVWRHTLGQSPDSDTAVFQEDDEAFNVGIDKSRDGQWLFISTGAVPGAASSRTCSACGATRPGVRGCAVEMRLSAPLRLQGKWLSRLARAGLPSTSRLAAWQQALSPETAQLPAGSAITSDVRFCSAHEPGGRFRLVLPRVHDVEYDVESRGDHFFIEMRCEALVLGRSGSV